MLRLGDDGTRERSKIDGAMVKAEHAGFELRDLQQLQRKVLQTPSCVLDHLEELILLFRSKRRPLRQEGGGVALDHGERCEELMTQGI
jgi:hypothetical protein